MQSGYEQFCEYSIAIAILSIKNGYGFFMDGSSLSGFLVEQCNIRFAICDYSDLCRVRSAFDPPRFVNLVSHLSINGFACMSFCWLLCEFYSCSTDFMLLLLSITDGISLLWRWFRQCRVGLFDLIVRTDVNLE